MLKGEAGTGNIVEAVKHMRAVMDGIRRLVNTPQEELMTQAKEMGAPFELVEEIHRFFAAGGVVSPRRQREFVTGNAKQCMPGFRAIKGVYKKGSRDLFMMS